MMQPGYGQPYAFAPGNVSYVRPAVAGSQGPMMMSSAVPSGAPAVRIQHRDRVCEGTALRKPASLRVLIAAECEQTVSVMNVKNESVTAISMPKVDFPPNAFDGL